MASFKQGPDPINGSPRPADNRHVVTEVDRYEELQGPMTSRMDAEVRKELVDRIDMESYEVNAPAVAEAILLRLLAGSAMAKRKSS